MPRTRIRTALTLATAALSALAVIVGGAAPASAGQDDPYAKERTASLGGNCLTAIVEKDDGWVWAAGYYCGTSSGASATIVLHQCDGFGRNCGAASARQAFIGRFEYATTSAKLVSLGHTYRACVSGGSPFVHVCTDLMAWNAG